MRLFGRKKEPLKTNSKQPATFIMALEKYKTHLDWTVVYQYLERPGTAPASIAEVAIRDTLPVGENIEAFLRETYGSGSFKVSIVNAAQEVLCSYVYTIGGAAPYKPKKKRGTVGEEEEREKKKKRSSIGDLAELATVFATIQGGGMNSLAEKIVENSMSGGSSGMEELAKDMLITKFNNDLSREEGDMSRLKNLVEVAQMFAPKVPPEDLTSSIIQMAPSFISALAMMKGGGAPAASVGPVAALPANGGLDIQALKELADSLPPEIIAQFPQAQQNALMQLRSAGPAASPESVSLPRPGAPVVTSPESPAQTLQDKTAADTPAVSPASTSPAGVSAAAGQPNHDALDVMVESVREDLRGDSTDKQIAQNMLSMFTAARGLTTEVPHPLFKGVMEATDETGQYEFRRFCAALPELNANPERIDTIGLEILALMEDGAKEVLEAQKAPAPEAIFEYETEAERITATEDQDGVHVPRSAGVSGREQRSEPRINADRDTSTETREEDDRQEAQAV